MVYDNNNNININIDNNDRKEDLELDEVLIAGLSASKSRSHQMCTSII